MALTAHDVETVQFTKPPAGKRGYHKQQVDDFLARVASTLNNRGNVSVDAVSNVTFAKPSFRQRGHNEDEVDAFLDLVAAELTRLLAEGAITLHQDAEPGIATPLLGKKRDGRRA